MQEKQNLSDYKQSLRNRILDTAIRNFAQRGVKGTKMDDVAVQLGISKRTLYEIYDTKEQVLFEGIRRQNELRNETLNAFSANPEHNVLDIIIYTYGMHVKESGNVKPQFFKEIQRYPRIAEYIEEQKSRKADEFLDFIKRGIDEGLFLPDIDYRLIAHVFEALGRYMNDQQLYEHYSFEQLFLNMLFVTLRGFCTQKGIVQLDRFFKEQRSRL